MKNILKLFCVLILFCVVVHALAKNTQTTHPSGTSSELPTEVEPSPKPAVYETADYKNYVYAKAIDEGLSKYQADQIIAVIMCESTWNTQAIGDNGNSFGLAQIHMPSHPEITPSQATDGHFAIDFIVSQWAKGNQWKWSCYRILYQ